MANFIVGALVLIAVALIVWRMVKNKRQGKGGCGCGCDGCAAGQCPMKSKQEP